MKKIFTLLLLLGTFLFASAQYTTPGQGQTYTLEDLVGISQGVVIFQDGNYHILEDLTISPTDIVEITESVTVKIAAARRIFINGTLIVDPQQGFVTFTPIEAETHFRGFRYDESNESVIRNAIFEYAGGIQLLNSTFPIEGSTFRYFNTSNTSAAVQLSGSHPSIINCLFLENAGSAIGSGANVQAHPKIMYNQLIKNVTANTNRPQINMGPSGADTLFIVGNIIEGQYPMSGGIAHSNVMGIGMSVAFVEDNFIFNNRYGFTATGNNMMSIIRGNVLLDNNIQNDPAVGGSGLNFLSTGLNEALVYNNYIEGNLWGVTIQGAATPNMGEQGNPETGFNVIQNNVNNETIFGLYNNTPGAIMAQNNYWGTSDEQEAADFIVGQHQNSELGPVTFLPLWIPQAEINSFIFLAEENHGLEEDISGVIDQDANTIILIVPAGNDLTALIPSIVVSPYATVDPDSGHPVDFTLPVSYSVTAAHGEEVIYEVSVIVDVPPAYTLIFNVVDQNNDPLENAAITLNGQQHPAGFYEFVELLPGTYEYVVELQGFTSVDGTVEIIDQDVIHTVVLEQTVNVTQRGLTEFKIFPNPAQSLVTISFQSAADNQLRLFSLTGALVMQQANISSGHKVDVSSLENGIYLLQLTQDQKTITLRLTITK
jgi:hypothetical protein